MAAQLHVKILPIFSHMTKIKQMIQFVWCWIASLIELILPTRKQSLFPTKGAKQNLEPTNIQLCSTGLDTKLVPFKNFKGEIEWKFTDEESDSDNSDTLSSKLSPFLTDHSGSSIESPDLKLEAERKYCCSLCKASFRIRGYLTRHMKKHASSKAYRCPFYEKDAKCKCHATGGFSRRDTFKTHLKSRHFKYPPGIKSGNRNGMIGWCTLCGQNFANNEIWVEKHIETGECPNLPEEYMKSLIQRGGRKKTGKQSRMLDIPSAPVPIGLPMDFPPLGMGGTPPNVNFSPLEPLSSTDSSPASEGYRYHEPARPPMPSMPVVPSQEEKELPLDLESSPGLEFLFSQERLLEYESTLQRSFPNYLFQEFHPVN